MELNPARSFNLYWQQREGQKVERWRTLPFSNLFSQFSADEQEARVQGARDFSCTADGFALWPNMCQPTQQLFPYAWKWLQKSRRVVHLMYNKQFFFNNITHTNMKWTHQRSCIPLLRSVKTRNFHVSSRTYLPHNATPRLESIVTIFWKSLQNYSTEDEM